VIDGGIIFIERREYLLKERENEREEGKKETKLS